MKAKIYFLLLATFLLSVPNLRGKSVKTYKEPQCLYSECSQAAVTRVEFANTATVVSFRLSGHPYEQFVLPQRIYTCGDDGGTFTQEEYDSFISNSLDGEACHRVSRDNFTDIREALHFTGSTGIRTFDRNGLVMRMPLSLDDETSFRFSLRRLLQTKQ